MFSSLLIRAFRDEMEKISAKTSEQVGKHFSDQDKKKWDSFYENTSSKRFVKVLSKHKDSDEKLIQHATSLYNLHKGKTLGKVPSFVGKGEYEIRKLPAGKLGCTCKDWRFKGSVNPEYKCKHIRKHETKD
jgi:hypothetical protein